jgi:hypothetical protein
LPTGRQSVESREELGAEDGAQRLDRAEKARMRWAPLRAVGDQGPCGSRKSESVKMLDICPTMITLERPTFL